MLPGQMGNTYPRVKCPGRTSTRNAARTPRQGDRGSLSVRAPTSDFVSRTLGKLVHELAAGAYLTGLIRPVLDARVRHALAGRAPAPDGVAGTSESLATQP